jgi:hypothetical protein
MDFELDPTITLRSMSFNVLQAPRELFIQAINRNLNLQRYKVLYVCGNYSGILSRLLFQLMTVLEEARHSIILIEHDPTLYEDAAEMIEYVSNALSDAAKESAVPLCSPGSDPFLEDLARNADRVCYFDEGPREQRQDS